MSRRCRRRVEVSHTTPGDVMWSRTRVCMDRALSLVRSFLPPSLFLSPTDIHRASQQEAFALPTIIVIPRFYITHYLFFFFFLSIPVISGVLSRLSLLSSARRLLCCSSIKL